MHTVRVPCLSRLSDWTDRELVNAYALTGAEQALGEVAARHGPRVFGICLRILGDAHDAEDAAQVTFLALASRARRLNAAPLAAWLCRTARLAALQIRRSRARRFHHEQDFARRQAMPNTPDQRTGDARISEHLDESMAALPARLHDAVALRYMAGLSDAEAANELGCSVHAVAVRVSRGLARMRAHLGKYGFGGSAAVVGGLLAAGSAQALPVGFVSATTALCTGKTAATGGMLALLKSMNGALLWAKVKIAATVAAALLFTGAGLMIGHARLAGGGIPVPTAPQAVLGAASADSGRSAAAPVPVQAGTDTTYDWPNWRGPYCNGTAADCGEPLVDNLSEATVLWKSEETIPDTVTEHTTVSVGSGFCEPIIHQGRVYLHYFVPTGKPDERMARALTKACQGRNVPPADIESTAKPQADHIVLCMDPLTGKTLWKAIFPEKSVNGNHVCWIYTLCAPKLDTCAADGRIASISASGRIFCLRATDGKPLWESNIGPEAERTMMHLDAYVRNHEFMGASRDAIRHVGQLNLAFDLSRNYFTDFDSSPNIVDGVLVTSDYWSGGKPNRPGVRGFDMVTGRHLWTVPNCSGPVSTLPIRWRHEGKDYVISAHSDRVLCIDPKNGKELWDIVDKNIAQESIPAISGDYLVVDGAGTYQNPNGLGPTLTCYLMSPEKAEKVWSAPASVRADTFYGPTIYQDRVYWRGAGVTCADLKTGNILKSAKLGMYNGILASDGRLFSHTRMAFADPAKWGSTSPGGKNPIPANAVYGDSVVSNGRLYYRTKTNVVCLELRKTPKPMPTPAVAKPTVAESTPVTELVGLLSGDNWQLQLAAAKVLTARGAAAKSCCPDLVAGVARAVTAGDQATASLLVKVIAAVDPSAIQTVVSVTAKSLDSKDTLVLVAACAALREAGPKAEPTAKTLAQLLATGDTQVTPAAADALAAIGPDATAAIDTLLTVLAGKDEAKALQVSRALMGIGIGAKDFAEKIVDGFCAHPGPTRYYLSETLRVIGTSTIPLLVQKTSAYMPVKSKVRGESKPGDPMLLLDTAVALSHFGTAAKETTPHMEKISEAMGSGSNSNERYRVFIEDSINMVNDRPVKRAVVAGKFGPPIPLGMDDGSKPSETTNKKEEIDHVK